MPNIATALKAEIARIARKEVRGETSDLRKLSSQHRSHIAALRRKVDELQRESKRAKRPGPTRAQKPQDEDTALRFRADGLASHRQRLGLSAADMGRLLGVSGPTVYKWEKGEARPRSSNMGAIAAVRKMGKREAVVQLASLG